jgi:hypothetical protein
VRSANAAVEKVRAPASVAHMKVFWGLGLVAQAAWLSALAWQALTLVF